MELFAGSSKQSSRVCHCDRPVTLSKSGRPRVALTARLGALWPNRTKVAGPLSERAWPWAMKAVHGWPPCPQLPPGSPSKPYPTLPQPTAIPRHAGSAWWRPPSPPCHTEDHAHVRGASPVTRALVVTGLGDIIVGKNIYPYGVSNAKLFGCKGKIQPVAFAL